MNVQRCHLLQLTREHMSYCPRTNLSREDDSERYPREGKNRSNFLKKTDEPELYFLRPSYQVKDEWAPTPQSLEPAKEGGASPQATILSEAKPATALQACSTRSYTLAQDPPHASPSPVCCRKITAKEAQAYAAAAGAAAAFGHCGEPKQIWGFAPAKYK